MDIISYGIAAQVTRAEKKMRETTLAVGVEGNHPHARSRVDALERAYQGITDRANQLAIQDAVNIMKAHAKLNVVAKSTKYKMHQMVFEDFLSAAGIDSAKSSGYTVDTTNGLVKASGIGNYTMVTAQEATDTVPKKVVLVVDEFEASKNSSPNFNGGAITVSGLPVDTAAGAKHTVEFWMYWNGNNAVMPLGFNSYDLYLVGGNIGVNTGSADLLGFSSSGLANTWVHVAWVTYNGVPNLTNNLIYINGVKQTLADVLKASSQSRFVSSNMSISGWGTDAQYRMGGSISEVRLWKGERTPDEIVNNMNRRLTGSEPNLIGYWKLEGNALDSSPNAKHGSATGITYISSLPSALITQASSQLKGVYQISRDDGITWEPITPEELFYFKDSISPINTKLRLKAELPSNVQLLNYGLTWV